MKKIRQYYLLIICFSIIACSGGGGGSSSTNGDGDSLGADGALSGNNDILTGIVNSETKKVESFIYIPPTSSVLRIKLSEYGQNDLDLQLLQSNGTVDRESVSESVTEEISRTVIGGNTYYINVIAFETGGVSTSYRLEINLGGTGSTGEPGTTGGGGTGTTGGGGGTGTTGGTGGSTSMAFQLTDGCNDGLSISYKFYDVTNNLVWPSSTTHWDTPGYLQSDIRNLSCSAGSTICYGARRSTGSFWGVDLDRSESCTACCFACTNGATVSRNLTCNS